VIRRGRALRQRKPDEAFPGLLRRDDSAYVESPVEN
jgi:hypothetical protein